VLSTNQNELCAVTRTTPSLRNYQKQFITDLYTQVRKGSKRILGFSATGSGKTLLAAQVAAHAASKNKRSLFVVHRETLISQTADKLSSFGLSECGFIKAGWQENREALVQIASVQTLERRDWWQELNVDIVILDEAHLTAFAAIVAKMMSEIFPYAIYLGLTATPWRLSKKESLGDIFETLVSAPMPHKLISSFSIAFSYKPFLGFVFALLHSNKRSDFIYEWYFKVCLTNIALRIPYHPRTSHPPRFLTKTQMRILL